MCEAMAMLSVRSGCIHLMQRKSKVKGRALSQIGLNPYASAVSLDDRTADRQSHAHSIGFGGDEGAKQPVCVLGGDPDTAVLHGYRHWVCFVLARSDHQLARPICDCFH